jgi:dTDP-4-amino-4,6-dideoxygalactose transaminase
MAISFHATKSFGTGEGGAVITSDLSLAERIGQVLNFGFAGSRDSAVVSVNGKMSEYHAAVGLAEYDGWSAKRHAFMQLAEEYRQRLRAIGREHDFFGAPAVAGCYALFRASSGDEAARISDLLRASHIDYRLWYGGGIASHSRFTHVRRDTLTVTDDIAQRLIGLPVAVDLCDTTLDRIVTAVASGCDS